MYMVKSLNNFTFELSAAPTAQECSSEVCKADFGILHFLHAEQIIQDRDKLVEIYFIRDFQEKCGQTHVMCTHII